ncbi:PQQ-binding-like beta-propeller repeat protein [Gemmata sp.]|uniref:PQQ-binding-like beta-propeller repeat protein n=1 Tax=Gemmata sp. TaxID=1914242 RepID=UPI003F6E7C82
MLRLASSSAFALTFALTLSAADWPQFRGPDRTGISKETGLLKAWPKDGPAKLWQVKGLGLGFGTPAVASGMIFGMGTRDEKDGVWALKEADGSELWFTPIDEARKPNQNNGPSGTPTFDNGKLYTISSKGKLACLDAKTGTVAWQADFVKDFGGGIPGWGYCESPLIDGDKLVCTPGKKNAIVALNKNTGEVIWKSALPKDEGAQYSSVLAAEIGGQRQYVQFLKGGVVSVGASDGAFLWRYDHPANGTANCSMPLVAGGMVFAASAYGTGGGMALVEKKGDTFEAKEEYFDKAMQNHHGGMVLIDGYVYGTGSNALRCVELKTGKVMWEERKPGKGSVTFADGMLYCRNEGSGKVFLVEANPKEYVEKGVLTQPDRSKNSAWAYPVVASGKLYLRDQDVLLCYDVAAK